MKHAEKFHDKLVLITGAAGGIGLATALAFGRLGARLIMTDVRADALEDAASAVGQAGASAVTTHGVDVSDRGAMRALSEHIHAEHPAVDILVNNAGVGLGGGIVDTSLEDWDWVLGVNLWGVIHGVHFFVPPMIERGVGGHVVNVSSVAGFFNVEALAAYGTSKYAVYGLGEALRVELRRHGIGVSTICPGVTATGIVQAMRASGEIATQRDQIAARFAQRGIGPEVVAEAIVDAVARDRGVVPVSREAKILAAIKRVMPERGPALFGRAADRLRQWWLA